MSYHLSGAECMFHHDNINNYYVTLVPDMIFISGDGIYKPAYKIPVKHNYT
jgi:hypothetical protein